MHPILRHPAVLALGPAGLICAPFIGPQINLNHLWIYQSQGTETSVFIASLLNLVFAWIVITVAVALGQRSQWWRMIIWSALIVVLLPLILEEWRTIGPWPIPTRFSALLSIVTSMIWGLWLLAHRRTLRASFEQARHATSIILLFLAFNTALMVAELSWCAERARALNAQPRLHEPGTNASAVPRPKVIWIVFDELSQRQLFAGRYPGISLPAFDSFAQQSVTFANVVPAGSLTAVVLPSLISGTPMQQIRSSADGYDLQYQEVDGAPWRDFDAHNTIFQDALNHGYGTAVVGWFNPYCKILPVVLDHCIWVWRAATTGGMVPGASVLTNTLAPTRTILSYVLSLRHPAGLAHERDDLEDQQHISDYQDLVSAADQRLSDPDTTFLLIHMPIPHPFGIYSRSTGRLTYGQGSYVDNLVLTDLYLAHVRRMLSDHGEWDSSTLLIMGDHSLRPMWQTSSRWTAEDQAATRDGFDGRPAYLLKLPYQQLPFHLDSHYAAIYTRSLLQEIMSGQLKSSTDVATFAALHTAP